MLKLLRKLSREHKISVVDRQDILSKRLFLFTIRMAAQDKRNNGRLIGRVKNAFTSKAHEDHVGTSSNKPRKPRRRPSLRVSFLEMRRSSLMGAPPKINELETPSNETMPDQHAHKEKRKSRAETVTSRVSFLDKNRSSFINEILGTTPTQDAAYHLGDVGRDEDMIITKGFEESLVGIAQLKEMDHAFVQRSNGQWRYSIVVATSKASTGEDPFIKFLVDDKGHTKEIPLRQWTKLIRLPANQTNDDDHLDSHADLMLSSMAVGGSDESFARIRKYKSDPEVQLHKTDRAKPMEDSRRMSESCIPNPSKRLPSRRRQKVCPTSHVSASFTSSRIPSDFNLGVRRDSGATVSTSRTCTTSASSRHRYSDMDAMKGSWRLSGVEKEHLTPNAFDLKSVKFNQIAFLAALNSISETSGG